MAPRRSVTGFSKGMIRDVDILNQPANSYRDSLNGDLIFNQDGSYSWENQKGNAVCFQIEARANTDAAKYIPLGYAKLPGVIVLFSVRHDFQASEIGVVGLNSVGNGVYKTLFNDLDDPNGLKLNFKNEIEVQVFYESSERIRVYWCDGVKSDSNTPRSFTFRFTGTSTQTNIPAVYFPVTTSVLFMDLYPDFRMGIIKYVQRVPGNLLSGVYQYFYRLKASDGSVTNFTSLTRTMMVPTKDVAANMHEYEMDGSGELTNKGNRIEIKGIDTRYDSIEVGYVYSKVENESFDVKIFTDAPITGAIMTFDHLSNLGEPVNDQEVFKILSSISAAKTVNHKKDTLYYGNIKEEFVSVNIDTVLNALSVKPIFREMRDDELPYRGIYTGGIKTGELTNQTPKNGNTIKRFNQSHVESYNISGDYVNYKGTQIENLYSGYFRGETYRLGIVFWSKKGTRSFVYHLCDITFPDMYDTAYSWVRVKPDGTTVSFSGNLPDPAWLTTTSSDAGSITPWTPIINPALSVYDSSPLFSSDNPGVDLEAAQGPGTAGLLNFLRVMGIEVSGININQHQSNIAGFEIVRAKRDKTILCQGLLMPCVRHEATKTPKGQNTPNGHFWVRPFVMEQQAWLYPLNNGDSLNDVFADDDLVTPGEYKLFGYTSNFEVPDVLFSAGRKPTLFSGDRLKVVGSAFAKHGNSNVRASGLPALTGVETRNHIITKLYNTNNPSHFNAAGNYPSTPEYGMTVQFVKDYLASFGPDGNLESYTATGPSIFDIRNEGFISRPDNSAFFQAQTTPGDRRMYSYSHDKTWYITHDNFGSGTCGWAASFFSYAGVATNISFLICNYVRPNPSPYGGPTLLSLQNTIFIPTGHFQPVNNPSFTDPAGYVYNDIEVWGGDCYLGFFTYLRLYPWYDGDNGVGNSEDYAIGHSFPLESEINHHMRSAPSPDNPHYGYVGSRPDATYVGSSSAYPSGLFWFDIDNKLLEEFNINTVLLNHENNLLFGTAPKDFLPLVHFPARWRYSESKIIGELEDSYRRFLANNFYDLDARYGSIVGSGYLFDTVYCLQESAFSRLRIYERALVESANMGTLTTGTGSRMDGVDYINTETGCQHQTSITTTDKAIYWVDVNRKKIMRFAQNGVRSLSDDRGLHFYCSTVLGAFLNVDNPSLGNGIVSAFDYKNNQLYISWRTTDYRDFPPDVRSFTTVSYNESIDSFVSFYSHQTTFYISHQQWLLSFNTTSNLTTNVRSTIWAHLIGPYGSYYGTVYQSSVAPVCQDVPIYAKAFDNIRLVCSANTPLVMDSIQMATEQQLSTITNLITDSRFKYQEGVYRGPLRTFTGTTRMRGQHIKIDFRINNTSNLFVRFSNLVTLYRISQRV